MADDDKLTLTGSALLENLSQKLAKRGPKPPELFRVVEITRDSRGRLSPQGQIWHADLAHVRRFGRAVAANSVSQGVLIADTSGGVVERIPVPPPGSAAAGWGQGWRDLPLPPAPPREKPRVLARTLAEKAAAAAAAALPKPLPPAPTPAPIPTPAPAPQPATAAAEKPFDPESTATLTPSPPPEGEAGVEITLP